MGSSIHSPTERAAQALTLCLCLALALGPARGQAQTADEARAKALFKSGMKTYDVGDFEGALKLYSDAYQLAPLPGFLFNIAQCHRQLNNFERAAFFYQRFIDTSRPRAANVDVAAGLLDEMKTRQAAKLAAESAKAEDEARKAAQQRKREEDRQAELKKLDAPLASALVPALTETAPPPPPPIAEEDPVYKKWWFWTVIALAVAGAAGGTAAGVLATAPRSTDLQPIGSH